MHDKDFTGHLVLTELCYPEDWNRLSVRIRTEGVPEGKDWGILMDKEESYYGS